MECYECGADDQEAIISTCFECRAVACNGHSHECVECHKRFCQNDISACENYDVHVVCNHCAVIKNGKGFCPDCAKDA